ncbi:UDP-N-acetylglucosamine transporter isoform X2 [Sitodiplosis mosellana]|uniref:UDP-N-acetylglucosamine transporter isoform X2 n=1 Tax=Sitodiplosis mosellana TaxID=263140 RepID=UPI0024437D3C|nr:UDP-N-acetylglucosamine transporter isoform X2 [Sitodiplosis mosellana]
MMIQKNKNTLKYVSLITLTLQNAILTLSMRYARTRASKEDLFYNTTVVVMSELTKLLTCLVLVFYEEDQNAEKFGKTLRKTIIENKIDTLKVCVPSLLYVIQNNLILISASHLDAATYQVTYQLKILTTAIFAVIILRKKLLVTQWGSLVFLIAGVVMVQMADQKETKIPHNLEQNRLLGLAAALGACVLSGFAGIFFEKMLKGADISVWMRNVQMSLLSIPLGFGVCMWLDFDKVNEHGFFHGYDAFVMYLVALQAGGGLLVAVVVKYADNILKGFATSLSIIVACIASIYLFDFKLSIQFAIGAGLVISAIFLYGYVPKPSKSSTRASNRSLDHIDIEKEREKDSTVVDKLVDKV